MTINPSVKSFFTKAGNSALGYAGRLGNQKHMTVIRDAFSILIPIVIAAGFAVLMRTFVFGAGAQQTSILGWIGYATGDTVANPVTWDNPNGVGASFRPGSDIWVANNFGNFGFYAISQAFVGFVSIYVAFCIGYLLAQARGVESPLINGFVATAAFIAATGAKTSLFDASGLLTAILVAIISSEVLTYLSRNKRLIIKMPDGVPPAVARSFARLFPAIIVLFAVFLVNLPFGLFAYFTQTRLPGAGFARNSTTELEGFSFQFSLGDAIYAGVQAPFVEFAANNQAGLGIALVYVLCVMLLWFFGLHGTNILQGVFNPLYTALLFGNLAGGTAIFTGVTFDAFIWFGGAGATLAFVVALLIFSKSKAERAIARLSIGPAIFNINEPVIYGIPMVLNVKWIVPFILAPVVLTIWTYLGYIWVDIAYTKVSVPWAVPPIISTLLATNFDWKAAILAIINLATAFLIYLPFVLYWTRKQVKDGAAVASAPMTSASTEPSALASSVESTKAPRKVRAK